VLVIPSKFVSHYDVLSLLKGIVNQIKNTLFILMLFQTQMISFLTWGRRISCPLYPIYNESEKIESGPGPYDSDTIYSKCFEAAC